MLFLEDGARREVWKEVIDSIEKYFSNVGSLPVTPKTDLEKLRALLDVLDFNAAMPPHEAIDLAVKGMTEFQVHTPHPGYFGLFNPAPATLGIAAETLVAAFNPQLAAWSHNPFANEVERHLVHAFGEKFGFGALERDGVFTSGGAEANHTALLTALVSAFPDYLEKGAANIGGQPAFYVSAESHHSFVKAARLSGIGSGAVRVVPVDDRLRMNIESLRVQISRDKAEGFQPFMIVGTVGTTSSGVIDPLVEISRVARENNLWFHADAAWGGAAVLVSELRPLIAGIESADSITFDAHKWLSVPMVAGIYLTRHKDILSRAFQTSTGYMPGKDGLDVVDPYAHSMSWSRRFIGLKVLLSLMVAGWDGYETVIRHQTAMGDFLREELTANDWEVVNKTKLPVICFIDRKQEASSDHLQKILDFVLSSGKSWISTTRLANGQNVLRACITNYRTTEENIKTLVGVLNEARAQSTYF